jgi:hypothetical protein
MPYHERLYGGYLGHKGVDQGGLADARLPRDDPHLPPALQRHAKPLVHLG